MKKVLTGIIVAIILSVVAAAGFASWISYDLHHPIAHKYAGQPFEVASGERLDEILRDLESHGIIDHSLPLRMYIKVDKQNPRIQAGFYYFASPITPLQVLARLKQGGDFGRLTVIEGWTRYEIADAMAKIPSFKLKDRGAALPLFNNVALVKDLDPKATNLEGYLFPDTYFIVSSTTPEELVKHMVARFREVWKTHLQATATKLGRKPRSVVTEASLIETEAKLKSERPIIASVVENRLKSNIPLSMDSTLIYAAKLVGSWKNDGKIYQSDIDRQSPYNTRHCKGLPPGPIASPGLSSLEAAVNPAHTSYIYYVRNPARNDGAHNFYCDSRSFETGVAALRAWEKQHPAKTR